MRALSLHQPWAWLVVHGNKSIENRVWSTKVRGSFLIHASKNITREGYESAIAFVNRVAPDIVVPTPSGLLYGGIVGHAHLSDVIPPCAGDLDSLCQHKWHMRGQYGFVLTDRRPLPFFACRGLQRWFDVPYPEVSP